MGGFRVEDGEDAPVQVGLASRLSVTGHGEDGGAGPVPGDQVGGPAHAEMQTRSRVGDRLALLTFKRMFSITAFCYGDSGGETAEQV